jgi:fructose-specific phosphotransferase system IIC component
MHSLANVNWLAVFVAPLIGFVLGFLWYGPLFGRAWMKLTGMTKEKGAEANMALTFGGTYLLNVVVAIGLATFLFEQKPFKLWLIDAGYQIVNFGAIGAILGLWPA